jgi:hypothetical protein
VLKPRVCPVRARSSGQTRTLAAKNGTPRQGLA